MSLDKNILKKKVFGIPVPIVAVGAGVVGVILFRKFGGGASSSGAGADGAATPADYSGGSAGSGGQASDYSSGAGDYGSSADMGLGGGGGGGISVLGGGGGFLPATDAGGLGGQPIINKVVKIIRPVRNVRRVSIVNKTVNNPRYTPPNKRRPNVVHNDKAIKSPVARGSGSAKAPVIAQKPTPPIIRRKPPVRRY